MSCGNTMFAFLRQNFINSVYKINQSFKYFDTQIVLVERRNKFSKCFQFSEYLLFCITHLHYIW